MFARRSSVYAFSVFVVRVKNTLFSALSVYNNIIITIISVVKRAMMVNTKISARAEKI
jgi:hypothetical protein